ncbi:nucleolar protein 58-like [Melia azedarach]|uniref:Nucleolar protein 58-like n=2 Tax=Melia azedarach TaxID=155640 RepID=A0ACC1YR64_MELAZ|nr:nucleolar protein 58-like [Melia azedarach]KAJ4725927.1 nucleolar protein 58-like [Melia azedarach]
MKAVTGKVLSTTPISLSKAASILSKFVSADNGASQAVCAYLRRASFSFNELNQLHKELKSHRKHKTSKSEIITDDEKPNRSVISIQRSSHPELSREPGSGVSESEKKKHKKKKDAVEDKLRIKNEEKPSEDAESNLVPETGKKKHKKKGEVGSLEEGKGKLKIEEEGNVGIENERKKHKKKQKQNAVEIGYLEEEKKKIKIEEDGDVGMENEGKKHKKKREPSGLELGNLKENGGEIVIEERKKRKSEEIEEGREMNSEESRSKKKRRKSERKS